MENAIKFLRIQNFKSIKDVTLHPNRVNLIIGEPNVGKSNLLEAMTLLGSITYEPTDRFLGSFIRYEEPRQLFYDNLVGNTIKVETDRDVAVLLFDRWEKKFEYLFADLELYQKIFSRPRSSSITGATKTANTIVPLKIPLEEIQQEVADRKGFPDLIYRDFVATGILNLDEENGPFYFGYAWLPLNPPKPYTFSKSIHLNQEDGYPFLVPPHGSNLIEVIRKHAPLRQEIARMFERYGQKLQLRVDERKLEVIKDQDGMTYSYPYSSVADTLQRIIFYLAAIESNDGAVLLFEEPEAHSFPVYVSRLGRRIVESRSNQFFIDTHSPYLITEVLEKMLPDEELAGELAIFAVYYDDHQTKIHQLSDAEIRSIREDGIDVFYNMKRFTTGAADA